MAIAPEGSTAEFTCVIKNCDSCFIRWEAFDTETGEPVSGMTQPRVVAEGNCVTSTISIVAVNNAVVQCEENNRFAKTKRERYHYSKMALLIVEKEGRWTLNRIPHHHNLTIHFFHCRIWGRVQINNYGVIYFILYNHNIFKTQSSSPK